jgi:hypothetical protein
LKTHDVKTHGLATIPSWQHQRSMFRTSCTI